MIEVVRGERCPGCSVVMDFDSEHFASCPHQARGVLVLVLPPRKRRRPRVCPGSGRRVTPTGSTAFPEVRCSCCERELAPVQMYGETHMRSHAPLGPVRS